ncbi:hypothetical protein FACS1894188_08140 [Clostridia bacterium]|nr:hypothetical protein FACS1894188_08140 [Clostridia bacterium]
MNKVVNYLTGVRKVKTEAANKIASPFQRHSDIREELEHWIETKKYPAENPITINGYTAEKISVLAPFMDGVGVYNFMITLRERPENAEKIIADGFSRK